MKIQKTTDAPTVGQQRLVTPSSDMPEATERNRAIYISILINCGKSVTEATRAFERANRQLWQSLA